MTTYRPDPVVDPEFDGFAANVAQLGALTGENTATWTGYLDAHRDAPRLLQVDGRDVDRSRPSDGARPATSSPAECQRLFDRALAGKVDADGRGAVPRRRC